MHWLQIPSSDLVDSCHRLSRLSRRTRKTRLPTRGRRVATALRQTAGLSPTIRLSTTSTSPTAISLSSSRQAAATVPQLVLCTAPFSAAFHASRSTAHRRRCTGGRSKNFERGEAPSRSFIATGGLGRLALSRWAGCSGVQVGRLYVKC